MIREVFLAFLRLGLTSFGGPVAHLGYFRNEFVFRRRWIDEPGYADLVALCQFLPGPASSQVGFCLGILRGGGLRGGLAAWLGFTAPSALVLTGLALAATALTGPLATGVLHGLKLVAVTVVAEALWGMARSLAPDRPRATIALAALALVSLLGGAMAQTAAIALGALAGLRVCPALAAPPTTHATFPIPHAAAVAALALAAALLLLPPLLAPTPTLALFNAFYRSGALVFGGGHLVLPLLQAQTVATGMVDEPSFLAGYGLAQAMPGPLFTVAAYLGASLHPPFQGAAIALIAIFLPGLLLVYGCLPFWDALRRRPTAQAAMRGANAAVVGILAAAFYTPVWTSAVLTPQDFLAVAIGFLLLTLWQTPPWIVVVLLAAAGGLASLIA